MIHCKQIAKLFSILAVVAAGFLMVQEAHADVYCRSNSTGKILCSGDAWYGSCGGDTSCLPDDLNTAQTTCPTDWSIYVDPSRPRTCTSRVAGSLTYGSALKMKSQVGDEDVYITYPSELYGSNYFDTYTVTSGYDEAQANMPVPVAEGESIDCDYYATGSDVSVPAKCRGYVTCVGFKVGNCPGNKKQLAFRESSIQCPVGYCYGRVDAWAQDDSHILETFNFGSDEVLSYDRQTCLAQFPDGALKKGIEAMTETVCSTGQFSENEILNSQVVQAVNPGLQNYESTSSFYQGLYTECKSDNTSPSGCGTGNQGGIYIDASPVTGDQISEEQCQAYGSILNCGNGSGGITVKPDEFGNKGCSLDNQGHCVCRCPNCADGETLSNESQFEGKGYYMIANEQVTPKAAAACIVDFVGNY